MGTHLFFVTASLLILTPQNTISDILASQSTESLVYLSPDSEEINKKKRKLEALEAGSDTPTQSPAKVNPFIKLPNLILQLNTIFSIETTQTFGNTVGESG